MRVSGGPVEPRKLSREQVRAQLAETRPAEPRGELVTGMRSTASRKQRRASAAPRASRRAGKRK